MHSGRMQEAGRACEYFGDVVSFNTTYNTNRYNLVLGSFVGVNHHGQSTLLGCALMKNEDIQSFKWLFECWLHCMGAKPPKGILTDQCALMQRAIEINWNDFIIKFGLGGNKWLSELYEDRLLWIPVYLDHHFWAGMRRTQRSETFFNKFQHVYTHEKFREVQAQFREKVNCITISMHSTLGFTTYEVVEQSKGILCRHSLSVLSFEQVDNVAPKYIPERWSKNIKKRHTHIKSSQDEPLLELRSKRFDDLMFRSHNICEFASEFEELTGILHRVFDNVMVEMQEYQERSKEKCLLSHEEVTLSDVNNFQSPPCVKIRGRSKNRLGSNLEKKISNDEEKEKASSKRQLNLLDGEPTIQPSSSFYNAPARRGLYKFLLT
ncbi:hypothetical protein Ahy_B09g096755 isoform A [Arachis hypogaea]|uniref:Protein FAR1-RELATED SEQUENCE n=1 Tax=Arachis hypogaea TaxID=3818 RepID=A0A444XM48_ARAHY|nr:hypothetical protein Ahy_B09g096755 isoform A [Arachis hypogaea]